MGSYAQLAVAGIFEGLIFHGKPTVGDVIDMADCFPELPQNTFLFSIISFLTVVSF